MVGLASIIGWENCRRGGRGSDDALPLFLPEGLLPLIEDFEPRQVHVGQIALAQTFQLNPRLNPLLAFGK